MASRLTGSGAVHDTAARACADHVDHRGVALARGMAFADITLARLAERRAL
jgi:hypothetical protein